jgi:hypothetical protein
LFDLFVVCGEFSALDAFGFARRDFAGFTSALLEAANPGCADTVSRGDDFGGVTAIAIGEDAFSQVE